MFQGTNDLEGVFSRNSLEPLEDLLNKESKRLLTLNQLFRSNQLNFGKKLKKKDFVDIFPKVKKDIDDFLEVDNINMPKLMYTNFNLGKTSPSTYLGYSFSLAYLGLAGVCLPIVTPIPAVAFAGLSSVCFLISLIQHYQDIKVVDEYRVVEEKIILRKGKKVPAILTLGHEYTHHVQFKRGVYSVDFDDEDENVFEKMKLTSILIEGHARGVSRHLANKYREEEDNLAFLYPLLQFDVGELRSTYLWLCDIFKLKPKKSLLKIRSRIDKDEAYIRKLREGPSLHAIGNSLFAVWEEAHGKNIYKDFIVQAIEL